MGKDKILIRATHMFFLFKGCSSRAPAGRYKKLIENKGLWDIVWAAAISRPLNRRTVGTLDEMIKEVERDVIQAEGYFPRPIWWKELLSI